MNRRKCWILFAVSVLVAGSVLSAHAQYLKIDGIPGRDTYDGEEGWIDIDADDIPHPFFSHAIHRDAEGNKMAAFVVVKEIDETSVLIYLAMLKGTVIDEVTYVSYVGGYMKWTFRDVTIVSIEIRGCSWQEYLYRSQEYEEITLRFKKIEWEYTTYDPDEEPVVGGWDVESDTEIPPPTAVNGFSAHQ